MFCDGVEVFEVCVLEVELIGELFLELLCDFLGLRIFVDGEDLAVWEGVECEFGDVAGAEGGVDDDEVFG